MSGPQPRKDRNAAYREHVAGVVAAAPPLSAAQLERLRQLLRPECAR